MNGHEEDMGECYICCVDLEVDDSVYICETCKHYFHEECVEQWIATGQSTCPMCRETL